MVASHAHPRAAHLSHCPRAPLANGYGGLLGLLGSRSLQTSHCPTSGLQATSASPATLHARAARQHAIGARHGVQHGRAPFTASTPHFASQVRATTKDPSLPLVHPVATAFICW
jgi:hypothetical protein